MVSTPEDESGFDDEFGGSGRTEVIERQFDESLDVCGVVDAIAAFEETDPMDLPVERGIVLYDHVNPDALDTIVTGSTVGNVEIGFTVDGYHVRVTKDRIVVSARGA